MKHCSSTFFFIILAIQFNAQNSYSTLTERESNTALLQVFEMSDQLYCIEMSTENEMAVDTCFISSIDEDGYVTKLKEIGNFYSSWRSILIENESFMISGYIDSTLIVRVFDQSFELTNERSIDLTPMLAYRIMKVIADDLYYYILINGNITNSDVSCLMYKLEKQNLQTVSYLEIPPNQERNYYYDIDFDEDETLILLSIHQVDTYDFFHQFNFFDKELTFLDSTITNVGAWPNSTLNMKVINSDHILTNQLWQNEGGVSMHNINSSGAVNWVTDSFFEAEKDRFSRIINFDLDEENSALVWGWGETMDSFTSAAVNGVIAKLDKNGQPDWSRTYEAKFNGVKRNGFILDGINLNDGYLFGGHTGSRYVYGQSNSIWLLKTNLEGCISNEPCEQLPSSTQNNPIGGSNENLYSIVNPTVDGLVIHLRTKLPRKIQVFSLEGKLTKIFQQFTLGQNKLDLHGVNNSLYFVTIQYPDGQVNTEKIIVNE